MADEQHVALLRQSGWAFTKWRRQQPSDVSPNFGGADLRGIDVSHVDLSGANFADADLSNSVFYACNFCGSNFMRTIINDADMADCDFRDTNLYSTSFSRSDLTSANFCGAQFCQVEFIDTELEMATFAGVDLKDANISGASLLMADIRDVNVSSIIWDSSRMRGKFRGIRGIDSCFGNAIFKRVASDQDFLDSLEYKMRQDGTYFLFIIWSFIDYGRSFAAVFLYLICMIVIFSAIYSIFPSLLLYSPGEKNVFSAYYFSIVTFTTLGFGDVRPAGQLGEIIVCVEVVLGYLGLGLLLSVLADKVARRS